MSYKHSSYPRRKRPDFSTGSRGRMIDSDLGSSTCLIRASTENARSNSFQSGGVRCYWCGNRGHVESCCFLKKRACGRDGDFIGNEKASQWSDLCCSVCKGSHYGKACIKTSNSSWDPDSDWRASRLRTGYAPSFSTEKTEATVTEDFQTEKRSRGCEKKQEDSEASVPHRNDSLVAVTILQCSTRLLLHCLSPKDRYLQDDSPVNKKLLVLYEKMLAVEKELEKLDVGNTKSYVTASVPTATVGTSTDSNHCASVGTITDLRENSQEKDIAKVITDVTPKRETSCDTFAQDNGMFGNLFSPSAPGLASLRLSVKSKPQVQREYQRLLEWDLMKFDALKRTHGQSPLHQRETHSASCSARDYLCRSAGVQRRQRREY